MRTEINIGLGQVELFKKLEFFFFDKKRVCRYNSDQRNIFQAYLPLSQLGFSSYVASML